MFVVLFFWFYDLSCYFGINDFEIGYEFCYCNFINGYFFWLIIFKG